MAKLTRSSNNKVIAGVCGGLAEHFELNANAVRIACILLLFLTFSAAGIAYHILMFLLPVSSSAEKYKERMQEKLKK